jgi:hypothetical protein
MKRLKALAIAILLVASITPAYAIDGCVTVYNSALMRCDRAYCPAGPIICAGCKADAVGEYWSCVYYAMTT